MDLSKYGIKEGFVKAIKVAGWVAASGAVAALAAKLDGYDISKVQVYYGLGIMAANAILAGFKEWLSTHKPVE